MKKSFSFRVVQLLLPVLILVGSPAGHTCDFSAEAVAKYERQILAAASAENSDEEVLLRAQDPLTCLFVIQRKASGFLKGLVAEVLSPFLGGPHSKALLDHPGYSRLNQILAKKRLEAPLKSSVVSLNAHGSWDFFQQFCGQGKLSFCAEFLPDQEQIKSQSGLQGASSIMMLKVAYLSLKGQDRQLIAKRIKDLYQKANFKDPLHRKALNEVYGELFNHKTTLHPMS